MDIEKIKNMSLKIDILKSNSVEDYEESIRFMEKRVLDIYNGKSQETIWFVEYNPLYTGGTSANDKDLINPRFSVFKTGRGGQYTYHGTGQRTVYLMLDLKKRNLGIKEYVTALEQWIIESLKVFGIKGERKCGRVGIWIDLKDGKEDKIAAIGVRVKKWISYHGIAININPNLSHFDGIVPCGISDSRYGVTSFEKLGFKTTIEDVDSVFIDTFFKCFAV